MKRRAFIASAVLLAAGAVRGNDYPPVLAGRALRFPEDFGSHPAFRSEWWYITGWVRDASGRDYGVQVTFFRNRPNVAEASTSRFAPRQLLFAHAAIADPRLGRLRHDQLAAREGFGLARAAEGTVDVAIDAWTLRLAGDAYVAHIEARDFTLDLAFAPTQPPMLEGERGFSRKGPDPINASYYYSIPQLRVSGRMTLRDGAVDVTGVAWFDHEWSSQTLAADAVGWDWTGINFDDGGALMVLRMRDKRGETLWADAMMRDATGTARQLAAGSIGFSPQRTWKSPRTGTTYPVAMRLRAGDAEYTLQPLLDDQELDSRGNTGTVYWEGAVRVMRDGHPVGRGYLELTGYHAALRL